MSDTYKRKKKTLSGRAYSYAWENNRDGPPTWSESEKISYRYGKEDGWLAGYKAAMRDLQREKTRSKK